MKELYDYAAIRKRIEASFNDDDFQIFCHDHFPLVRKQFTAGQTLGSRILALVDHVRRYGLEEKLLAAIKNSNPYEPGNTVQGHVVQGPFMGNVGVVNQISSTGDSINISGGNVVFSKDQAGNGNATGRSASGKKGGPAFDVCVICALPEEAKALMHVFAERFGTDFARDFGADNREFRKAVIRNDMNEKLKIHVSCPPRFGPVEAGIHCKAVLDEFKPRFAAMTGICAGDRNEVVLGDIVVAERAFIYDSGKVKADSYAHDTDTYHPNMNVRQYILMFNSWEKEAGKLKRPISMRSQKDWILNTLLDDATPRVDGIPRDVLEQHAPQWRKAVKALQKDSLLTKDRRLVDKEAIAEREFDEEDFPFRDPDMPKCHVAAMASGSSVRADGPFDMIREPVRKAVAVDMEGAAFYRAVADYPGISSLLAKGVCDYADSEKDDTYHDYASKLSAIYMASFVREYVNSRVMPVGAA